MYEKRFVASEIMIVKELFYTLVCRFNKERLSAVFLDHDRSNSYETTTFTRKIRNILRHRSYGQGGNYNNDIALLLLDKEVSLSDMTRPVCLPPTGKSFSGLDGNKQCFYYFFFKLATYKLMYRNSSRLGRDCISRCDFH